MDQPHCARTLLIVGVSALLFQCSSGFSWTADYLFAFSASRPAQDLLILGDSLSDNGNAFIISNRSRPDSSQGYWEGRFSNGPVWNEYFAEKSHLKLTNHAIGGAEACNSTFVASLREQARKLRGNVSASPSTIVGISIGGNDYLTPLRVLDQDPPPPELVVGCVVEVLEELLEQGFRNIFVWNLPTATFGTMKAPAAQGLDFLEPVYLHHNQLLADALVHVQYKNPSARVIVFDFWQSFEDIYATGKEIFADPLEPCLVFSGGHPNTLLTTCPNPYDHINWDELHPATRTHAILGDDVHRLLSKQGWLL